MKPTVEQVSARLVNLRAIAKDENHKDIRLIKEEIRICEEMQRILVKGDKDV
jgi:hypothetical protein